MNDINGKWSQTEDVYLMNDEGIYSCNESNNILHFIDASKLDDHSYASVIIHIPLYISFSFLFHYLLLFFYSFVMVWFFHCILLSTRKMTYIA